MKKLFSAVSAIILSLVSASFSACDLQLPKGGSAVSGEAPTEEFTREPPVPVECSDPNAVTFDDGDVSFADPVMDDKDSACGEIVLGEIDGNKMLRFADDGTNCADGTVQKVRIDVQRLLSHESIAKVRSVELDVYADATAEALHREDGSSIQAPGWIGGGAGTLVNGEKWYGFKEWAGGEYDFPTSGAIHLQLKFLLADSGRCWSEDMDETYFQIMRWGAQNEGDLYIDNIVFFDEDGNSLPLERTAAPDDTAKSTENAAEN